jgi:hypothetical protein
MEQPERLYRGRAARLVSPALMNDLLEVVFISAVSVKKDN